MAKKSLPFGQWPSPLSSRALATALRFGDVAWSADATTLVWLEVRDGRGVLVAKPHAQAPRDLHDELSVRGGVGYGGGEFCLHARDAFFAASDGRLYRTSLDWGTPRPLTPAWGRVASPCLSPDGRHVVYVHTDGKQDCLALVEADGSGWPRQLVQGADFYMQPAFAPDGARLCWVAWDHPNMPWNGTRLETASVHRDERGLYLGPVDVWDGGDDVAILQPTFSPNGRHLAYASDESGFWHLYVRDMRSGLIRQLTEGEGEFGGPAWVQGMRVFAWSADSSGLWVVHNRRGRASLARVSLTGEVNACAELAEYEAMAQPAVSATGEVALIGSSSRIPPRIVTWNPLQPGLMPSVACRSTSERMAPEALAPAHPVRFKHGPESGRVEVHGLFYPPTSALYAAQGKPPAILMIHGGPTSQRTAAWDARNQFFATRGFAVLDLNYRGSSGYGRAYMKALFGKWGVADVEDAIGAAAFLAEKGLVDPDRIAIMGGSAGGYTVLQALVNHPGVFAAGVCLYGISNLFALQAATHKFEAHYNDSLIGPLPEADELYRQRSPLFRAERIRDPLAIYHGAKDEVVPPDQAEMLVQSLQARGVPHVFHLYGEEGHGWRRAETIAHFHDTLLAFLERHLLQRGSGS